MSDGERYVTLLLAEIDSHKRTLCQLRPQSRASVSGKDGHGHAHEFILSANRNIPEEICELASADLIAGDVLVFYTDGGTEAENRSGEEFGTERLCSVVRQGSSLSAEELMSDIFRTAADFCQEVGFRDHATILVVKCNFDGPQQLNS